MMGPEYFTVAGYATDGAIVCRDCGEKQALPASDQITEAQAYADFGDTGMYCDACGTEIVEPYIEEEESDEENYEC